MKNVKLDKETFIELMTYVKTWSKFSENRAEKFADAIYTPTMFCTKSDLKYSFEEILCDPEMLDVLLKIIIRAMDDTETDWINYYVYELDWGEKNDTLKVFKEDGKTEIKLTDLEDLYKILTE